jgi:hypothetical protein
MYSIKEEIARSYKFDEKSRICTIIKLKTLKFSKNEDLIESNLKKMKTS